mgnify:CR=1 FL=1
MFAPAARFDRIISVEMFEHMTNWRQLMTRVRAWLKPDEKEWRWSDTHYLHTAHDWLDNFDTHRDEIEPVLRNVYGSNTVLWMRRWRSFFLATAGLFGYAGGSARGVSHYRLKTAG